MELISAAKNGDFTQVFNLLQIGYQADSRDHDNATPLYWSACHGHATLCEVLLQAGSDVNARVKWGSTPLHAASDRGHTDCAKVLIENSGNVNCQNNRGDTPLHIAAYRGNMAIVRELLQASTDTTLVNDNRKTPQEEAVEGGHIEIAERIKAYSGGNLGVLNADQRNKGPPKINNITMDPPSNFRHSNGTMNHSRYHSNVSATTASLTESICSSYDSSMDSEQYDLSESRCNSSISRPTNQGPPTIQRSFSVGYHERSRPRVEKINSYGDIRNTGYLNYMELTNDINKGYSSLDSLERENIKMNFRAKVECNNPKLTSNGRCIATESIDYSEQPIAREDNVLRRDLSETGLQNMCNTHPLRASTGSVKEAARLSESVETYIRTLQNQLVNAYKDIEALTTEKESLKFKCSTVLNRLSDTEKLLGEKQNECAQLKSLVDVLKKDNCVERFVGNNDDMGGRRMRGSSNGVCVQPQQQIEISSIQDIVKDKLFHLSQQPSPVNDISGYRDKVWVPGEDYVIIGDKQTTWLGVTSSKRVPLAVGFSIKHLKSGNRFCLTMLLNLDDPTSAYWSFDSVIKKCEAKITNFSNHPNVLTSLHRYEASTERFKKFVTAPKSKSVRLCANTLFTITVESKTFQSLVDTINRDRDSSTFPLSSYGSCMEFILQISYQLLCVVSDLEKHSVFHGNISENTIAFDKTLRPLLCYLGMFEEDNEYRQTNKLTSTSGDYINLPREKANVRSDLITVCELLYKSLFCHALVSCNSPEDQNIQRRFSLVKQTLHDVTLSTSYVPNCQLILKRVGCILCGPSEGDIRSQVDCEKFMRQKLLQLPSELEHERYKDVYAEYISIPESVGLRRPEVLAHFLCNITAKEMWEIFQTCDFKDIKVQC